MKTPKSNTQFESILEHRLSFDKENEVKSEMLKLKSPYLRKIQQAKTHFQAIKEGFERKERIQRDIAERIQIKQTSPPESQPSNLTTERLVNEPQRIFTQSSNEDPIIDQERQPNYREWTLQPSQKHLFRQKTDLLEAYHQIFQKKNKATKWDIKGESFKIQEKHIIERIYREIGDLQDKTVTFSAVIDFFQKCPLFYHIYNIHPNSLTSVIKQSAHKHEQKLTEQEFMNLFLLNSRTNLDYDNYNVQKVTKRCVLDEYSWKDLKEVFAIFDTFGNETVQLKQWIQKLKISLAFKHLLQKQTIEFPSIGRSYKLKKILFEMEHKMKMGDKFVRWEEIKKLISNFDHLKEPTIDVIQRKSLAAAKISYSSNTFMLKDQIISFIKEAFARSPKYCEHFVKVSLFCQEIYDSQRSKQYLPQIVRSNPEKVTFGQALVKLKGCELQYMDLDQIVEWFSIKDPSKQAEKIAIKTFNELKDSDSDDQEFNRKRRENYKKNKNIQNLPTKFAHTQTKEVTKIEQFNLTKKKKTTIRQRKVQEMIREKQEKERKECQIKFKANSIPSSINQDKYTEYLKKMEKNKDMILSKLNHVNERDILLLKYLETNTKLFEQPKIQEKSEEKYVFEPKPIPWFVRVNMLDQIEEEKEVRIKNRSKQTIHKYLKEWKKLPGFLQEMNFITEVALDKNNSQIVLFNDFESSQTSKKNVKQVPNFKELHQRFQEELEKRKNVFKPTVVKQFNLTSPKQSKQVSEMIAKEINQNQSVKKRTPVPDGNNYIGSTIKYQAMVKLNQQKKEAAIKKTQQERQANKQRKKNQREFAKYMRKELLKEVSLMNASYSNFSTRSQQKQFQAKHKKEIAEIYRRVFMRPFLFQSKSPTNKSNGVLEGKARPVQFNDESPNKIYEIVSDLGSERVEVDLMKKEKQEATVVEDRKSY